MKIHANARTCPNSRGLAPKHVPGRIPESVVDAITTLRRPRMTLAKITKVLGLPRSTVSIWLKRVGLGKRSRLELPEPPNRHERSSSGETLHVCVDDAMRLAYVEILPNLAGRDRDRLSCASARVDLPARRGGRASDDRQPAWEDIAGRGADLAARVGGAHHYPRSIERRCPLRSVLRYYIRRRPHSSSGTRPPITCVHNVSGKDRWRARSHCRVQAGSRMRNLANSEDGSRALSRHFSAPFHHHLARTRRPAPQQLTDGRVPVTNRSAAVLAAERLRRTKCGKLGPWVSHWSRYSR
jgi:hypothetical protein